MRDDSAARSSMRSFGPFRLDVTNQCLWRGDSRVSLMPKPFAVLRYLVENPGQLVTHDQLLSAIWPDTYVQPEVLRRYILEIRRALGDRAEAPEFVRTFPKRGYQFIAPVTDDAAVLSPESVAVAAMGLVGRREALADLDRCLTRALDGRRQVVFVVGEPGIGKTSLVDAFQQASAAIGVAVVRGQSVEGFGGKEAYYPLLEAIGQLARGPLRAVVVDTLATYAPTWLIQLPSLVRPDQHAALQREILGASRERMVRELCEALEVLTQTMPLVLILEDLHWVDNCTLDIISAIARRRERAKLLLLGTFRPADLILSASPLKALRQDLLLHHLSYEVGLERLEQSDVADYLGAEFTPGDLPPGLSAIIHRHSDGNPLFMTAMLDHLIRQGVVSRVDGRWGLTTPLEQVDPGVPETLRQMLEMQLQHTTDAEQRVLTCGSIVGQRFTAWAVATMLADDPAEIEELCDGLVQRHQFIKSAGARQYPCGVTAVEYEFSHWLYRDVLYRRLNPGTRIGFHRKLAEGFEALGAAVQSEMASEIALHFEEGHDYDRAVTSLLLTAHNATRRYAHGQAVAILEHASELLPRLPPGRREALNVQILAKTGAACYALGEMNRAAEAYESMAYHDEVTGDQVNATATLEAWKRAFPLEYEPVNSLAVIHNFLGRFERAIDEGLEAVRRNGSHGYPYSNLAHAYRGVGRFDDARKTAERAVALEVETLPTRRLLFQLAIAAGDEQSAERHLRWARDRPREFDMIGARAQARGWFGRVREARQLYEEAALVAERRGFPDAGTSHLAWATAMELAYGHTRQAIELTERVLTRKPGYDSQLRAALTLALSGSPQLAASIAHDLAAANPEHTLINSVLVPMVRAGIAIAQAEPVRAIEHLEAVAPFELGFIAALAPIYLRGQSYLMLGMAREAAEQFRRILDHRGTDPFSPFHAVAPLALARAWAAAGNVDESVTSYEQFFTAWAQADADLPVLLEARREYEHLIREASAPNASFGV